MENLEVISLERKRLNIALLLSGGRGTRLGSDIPKQYMEVGGRSVISYSIETLALHEGIDAIWIVAEPCWEDQIRKCVDTFDESRKFRGFSAPGENRQLSILHGLEDIRSCADGESLVLIHDAARPLLSAEQITACLDAATGYDGVLPVLPMKDTVYRSTDGKRVSALLNRSEIYAGQAPELFRLGKYYEANKRLLPNQILQINGSTEPAIMAGMNIAMISGDENNFKITTKADLDRFTGIIQGQREQ